MYFYKKKMPIDLINSSLAQLVLTNRCMNKKINKLLGYVKLLMLFSLLVKQEIILF